MFQTLILGAMGGVIGILTFPFAIYTYYLIYKFFKSARVHYFQYDNIQYPSFFYGILSETLLAYAYSITGRYKFYISNKRILYRIRSLFASKDSCHSIPISTVNTTSVQYYNPYWLLIYACIIVLYTLYAIISLMSASSVRNSNYYESSSSNTGTIFLIVLGTIIWVAIIYGLWSYHRGYQLIIKNPRTTFYLLSRDRKGLLDLAHKIDLLRLSLETIPEIEGNALAIRSSDDETKEGISSSIEHYSDRLEASLKSKLEAGKRKIDTITGTEKSVYIASSKTLDQTCSSCKSIVTLEEEDLRSDTYTCPVCNTINNIVKQT